MKFKIEFEKEGEIFDCTNCPFRHTYKQSEFITPEKDNMTFTTEITREVSECQGGKTCFEIEFPINFGIGKCPIRQLKD